MKAGVFASIACGLAVLACSCGSSGEDTGATTLAPPTTTSADSPGSEFCDAVPDDFLSGEGRPADQPFTDSEMNEDRAQIDRMVEAAPPSIAAAVADLRDKQREYFDLLARYDNNPRQLLDEATPDEMEVLNRAVDGNSPSWATLVAYLRENCENVEISPNVPG